MSKMALPALCDNDESQDEAGNSRLSRVSQTVSAKIMGYVRTEPSSLAQTTEQGLLILNNVVYNVTVDTGVEFPSNMINIELPVCHESVPFASGPTPKTLDASTQTSHSHQDSQISAEVLCLANAFKDSEQGKHLKRKIDELDLDEIDKSKFTEFMDNNFSGGVTKTSVGGIFACLGWFARRALLGYVEKKSDRTLKKIVQDCLDYVTEKVCVWVQANGGWEAVLLKTAQVTAVKIMMTVGIIGAATAVVAGLLFLVWKK